MKNLILLKILFISLLMSTISLSQTQPRVEEIERQLNRLESKIREARRFGELFHDQELRNIIQNASQEHGLAQSAFISQNYIVAVSHIKLGYFYLSQFYLRLKNNDRFRQRFKEQLDLKIQEAEQKIFQSPNSEAAKLLNRAKYYRERAFQTFRNDQPEAMFRNYFVAIFFAESALRISSGQEIRYASEFNRYLEDSKELYNQVEEMAGNEADETIRKILRNARRELLNVQQLYDQNLYRQAFQKLQIVNRFLYRALDLLESTPSSLSERLDLDLQLLEDRITDLRPEIELSTDEQVHKIFERTLFLTSKARNKYNSNDPVGARQSISLANRLVFQIHRRLNNTGQSLHNQLQDQLETAEMMLQSLKLEKVEHPTYERLLELQESNYLNAKEQTQQGNQKLAFQYLQIFNRLAVKTNQLRSEYSVEDNQQVQIENNLQRLENMLENAPEKTRQDIQLQANYYNAKKLYEIAREACKSGYFEMCNQLSRMAINLLTQ
ncbi:MAG: hypothetical protein JSW33_16870 [bacterium]|nr:MAG: hypothetical protein JSW33_16870 [bacterium]